jgi:hypothetical protein
MSRYQCLLRYGRCSYDLYGRCCVRFPCISAQLSALRRTEVRTLLKIPGFTQISWQKFSALCSNTRTSKSMLGAEHTKAFRCPQCQKAQIIEVRGSFRPVDWASASYPMFTESLIQVLSDNAEKVRWCPIMHEPHTRMLSLLVNVPSENYGTLHLLVF